MPKSNNISEKPGIGSIVALMAVSSLTINAGAIIVPSLPSIHEHFRALPNALILSKLVLTITALAIAICAPLAGWLVDRMGRRPLLIGSLVLCTAAGTTGLYLDSLVHILIGRALLGIAVAGIMTSSTTLIGDYFTGSRRNFIVGLQGALLGVGGVILLFAGGHLAELSWRYPFALYGIALVFLPIVVLYIYEPDSLVHEHFDEATTPGLSHHRILFAIAMYVSAIATQVAFYVIPVHVPFFLKHIEIHAPSQAGAALAYLVITAAIAAFLYRWVKKWVSYALILSYSLLIMAVGYVLLARSSSYGDVVVAMAVTGWGLGTIYPNLISWTMAKTSPHIRGRVIGGLTMSFFLGQFLSPVATEPLYRSLGAEPTFFITGIALVAFALPFGIYGLIQRRR